MVWNMQIMNEDTGEIVESLCFLPKDEINDAVDSFCTSLSMYYVVDDMHTTNAARTLTVHGRMEGDTDEHDFKINAWGVL